jgi:DNA-binding SARP family transcriptional activator
MLRLKLLGSGRVLDGEVEVKLQSRNWTLPLLAYVVLHRTETIPRWRLAFTLWPDETEEAAVQNLRRNLYRLLKALPTQPGGQPWLSVDSENIVWNGDAFQLDVAEYERLRANPATIEEAVELYRGDLLEEIYDDWVAAERERLRQLHHADLAALIVANRTRRAYGKSIAYARRLMALDPWREDTLRHLMSARYESGDAAGALAEFDRFARSLRTEMNAEPMHETLGLRDAIARGAAIPATLDARKFPAKLAPLATPFVGREHELEQLRRHWERGASGGGGLVLVRGDAGIGKSRLASEIALRIESEGGRVLSGATSSPERQPYECVAEALLQGLAMIAALPLPPSIFSVVAEIVPELRAIRPDLPSLARLDERSERLRLSEAIAQTFAALARPRPLLVILEDLQWADGATIDLITSLAQRTGEAPVLFIATSREGRVAGAIALRPAHRVLLGPLDEGAVIALAESMTTRIDDDLVRLIFERSRGNSLFATEMLRDAARGSYDATAVPENVTTMVASRVESLGTGARGLVEVAAVAGAAFAFDVVAGVSGSSSADVLAGLDELIDRHLIRESTERGRYEYAFTHDLVRQAIYDAIPAEIRARRHLRVGHVLEVEYADADLKPAGEIALHYDRGGDALGAARWYLLAARRAARLYANLAARELVTRGLELTATDDDRLFFDLLVVRQEVNLRLGDQEAHRVDLERLSAIGERLDSEAALTVARLKVERAHNWGDIAGEVASAARLRQLADASGDLRWLALAMELQAAALVRAAQQVHALVPSLEARALYAELGDTAGQVHAATFASAACTGLGRNEEAARYFEEALEIAKAAGDPMLQIFALRAACAQTADTQQYARSAAFAREMLRLSTDAGHRIMEAMSHASLAHALCGLWCVEEGLAHSRAARSLLEPTGWSYSGPYAVYARGDLGNFDDAIRGYDQIEAASLQNGRSVDLVDALHNKAYIWWQLGEIERMRAALDGASKLIERIDYKPVLLDSARHRARLMRHEGRFDESAELLRSTLDDLRTWPRPIDEIVTMDEIAATYLAARQLELAVVNLEASAELADRLEDPQALYNPVAHHWIAAQVYGAAGDGARRDAALNAAWRAYEERRDAIGEAALRASFEAMPLHRELRSAIEAMSAT